MTALVDDLTRPPVARASVELPGDAADGVVDLKPLGPSGTTACRSIRWMGSGPASLWYCPATPRENYTASEAAADVPLLFAGREWVPLGFLTQGEEQPVQATAILADDGAGHVSTAGTYVVIY